MKLESLVSIKTTALAVFGATGGFVVAALGGWDTALKTLIILMAVDYVTGLIVAGVFHNSSKSETGALESRAGWKGLCRKGMTLVLVLVAYHLDSATGTSFIRSTVIIAFIANESLSVVENAGLMGVPVPSILQKAIEALKQRAEETEVK